MLNQFHLHIYYQNILYDLWVDIKCELCKLRYCKDTNFLITATPKNFVMTTISATRADKVGIITTLCFQWTSKHIFYKYARMMLCAEIAWYLSNRISLWIQAIQSGKAKAKPCTEYIIVRPFKIKFIRNVNGDVVDHLLSHNFYICTMTETSLKSVEDISDEIVSVMTILLQAVPAMWQDWLWCCVGQILRIL